MEIIVTDILAEGQTVVNVLYESFSKIGRTCSGAGTFTVTPPSYSEPSQYFHLPIGTIMNLISTCSFACTAAIIYKKKHTLKGAVIGLAVGSVVMVVTMMLWNWLISPLYMFEINSPEDLAAARASVEALLLPAFLPFNLLKAGLNSAFILCLYKPLVTALRKTGLIPSPNAQKGSSKLGIYLFAGALLVSCILLLLVFQGKL